MKKILLAFLAVCGCLCAVAALGGSGASAADGKLSGVIVLDDIEKAYGPVRFDHATHTFIAKGCGECHHQHETDLKCLGCHSMESSAFKKSVSNTFMACSSCHGEYYPDMPQMPGLKTAYHAACFKCHREMGDVGRDPKGCTEKCHVKK